MTAVLSLFFVILLADVPITGPQPQAFATVPTFSPSFWGWGEGAAGQFPPSAEWANISVPVAAPSAMEAAWVMAVSDHGFTQVGWEWQQGWPAPKLFAFSDVRGDAWQAPGAGSWGAGDWYIGPVVHHSIKVRIVQGPVYQDQAKVGPKWVTVQSTSIVGQPAWVADMESYSPHVPAPVCFTGRAELVWGSRVPLPDGCQPAP